MTNLSNHQLHQSIQTLVQKERSITKEIIEQLAEVNRRKMFFEFGKTNLYGYLTLLGYEGGALQRRLDAVYLLEAVPQVAESLVKGEISLEQISTLSQGLRQKEKESGEKVGLEIKKQLVESLKNENPYSTQKIVAQSLDIQPKEFEKKRVQKDESVRVEITLSKEQFALLEKVKELASHVNPGMSLAETIELTAKEYIKRKDPARTSGRKLNMETTSGRKLEQKTIGVAAARRFIFQKDQSCQWVDPETGQKCGSRYFLQVDHIKSKWQGGGNEIKNLQLLCGAHNRLKYREEVNGVQEDVEYLG